LVPDEILIVDDLGFSYNIIAYTENSAMTSVEFFVNGQSITKDPESPYALCGKINREYDPCSSSSFPYGSVSIKAESLHGSHVMHSIEISLTIQQSSVDD
jgi:hypothetical protein